MKYGTAIWICGRRKVGVESMIIHLELRYARRILEYIRWYIFLKLLMKQ